MTMRLGSVNTTGRRIQWTMRARATSQEKTIMCMTNYFCVRSSWSETAESKSHALLRQVKSIKSAKASLFLYGHYLVH